MAPGLRLLYSYSQRDCNHAAELAKRLKPLVLKRSIQVWDPSQAHPGLSLSTQIAEHLERADVFVALLSADFLAEEACLDQMDRALRRQQAGLLRVVPVRIRPVELDLTELAPLQTLPKGEPVSRWDDADAAWLSVVAALREILDGMSPAHPSPAAPEPSAPAELRDQLFRLAEEAYEAEAADATVALLDGAHVAFEVPAGFGATDAVQKVKHLCQGIDKVAVHWVSAHILAPDLDGFLDDIQEELKHKAPLPDRFKDEKRDWRLFRELREAARHMHAQGRRLVVCVDDVERFSEAHQEWLAKLLGIFAHLADYSENDPALKSVGVMVAGGEWLQRHLLGRVKASPLSPFNKARRIFLGPVSAPSDATDELRQVIEAVGGHPRLLRWAAARGGRTDGHPASHPGFFQEQVARLRQEPHRGQLQLMLDGDEPAWRDQDPTIRWSGWVRKDELGWLGPVLERLARYAVADRGSLGES